MITLLILVALVAAVGLWIMGAYNGLVRLRNAVRNSWSQIDVQLKRRYDLIPNLLETVKGYASHERETLESVTKARQQAIDVSGGVQAQAAAENMLSQTLRSLFAVSESYPDLKANENFLALQEELSSTENKISFSRQHYNDSVMRYNNQTEMFPSNVIAGMFSFTASEFFEIDDDEEREVPKVSFS